MAVAMVATASCSNELDDTLQPVENGNWQFVVSDFPAFGEDPQTRASSFGTPDAGKTAWEEGDAIFVHLYSGEYGSQVATLTFNAEKSTWTPSGTLNYLENETLTVSAVYAPGCKVSENTIVLDDNQVYGMAEYIYADTNIEDNTLRISFEGVKRHYSRLRIVAVAGQTLTVTTTGFTPAGPEGTTAPNSYTLVTDTPNGNAFLYGTFAEGATVSVKQGDVTLKDYTFTAEKNPNGTVAGKSYALYAGPSFSVSADKKVLFSPGNLQYTQSTDTWSFAETQWDMLGDANVENGTLADKIDLFGHSSDNSATPFGVSASEEENDYVGNFVDWGTNKIGDDAPGTWRTLSSDEWFYLLHGRENAESLFALSTVNDVPGLIILPDKWVTPSDLTFVATTTEEGWEWDETLSQYLSYNDSKFLHNTYAVEEWERMEAAGAVFLPVGGERYVTEIDYSSEGFYRSTDGNAVMHIKGTNVTPNIDWYAGGGCSVRLVKDL